MLERLERLQFLNFFFDITKIHNVVFKISAAKKMLFKRIRTPQLWFSFWPAEKMPSSPKTTRSSAALSYHFDLAQFRFPSSILIWSLN